MATADRYFRRPFGSFLPDDFGKIHVPASVRRLRGRPGIFRPVPDQQVVPVLLLLQHRQHVGQRVHSVDARLPEFGRLQCRLRRQDASLEAKPHRHFRIGQRSRHRTDRSIQAQLPHDQILVQSTQISLVGSGNNTQCDGEVVSAAVLMKIGGGQIDNYFLSGDVEIHRLQRSHRAEQALFHRHVRQPDQMYPNPAVDLDLD